MRYLKNQKCILLTAVLVFGVFSFLGSAGAMNWMLGSDTELLVDVALTYGLGIRMADQDDELLADVNGDDGDRNFDQYSIYNNKFTVLADVELSYKNVGAFVRPKAFYDFAYMGDNDNDSPGTNNSLAAGLIDETNEFTEYAKDIHGSNAEILDYFVYGSWFFGEVPFDIRAGSQVISWGESSLIPGLSAAQAPVDVSAATAVGTETKEIFMPTGAVYVQTGFRDLGLRGYYQYEWKGNRLYESGSYWATSDFLNETPATFYTTIPRIEKKDAKDDGQYGVAATYLLPWNSTEVGLYYLKYHTKNPYLDVTGSGYTVFYHEDIDLYGFSASTVLADVQLGFETAYHDDFLFQSRELGGNQEGGFLQTQLNFTYLFSPKILMDRVILSGEAAYGTTTELSHDEDGWKYVGRIFLDWYQAFPKGDMGLNFAVGDTPKGNGASGTLAAFDFREDFSAASVQVDCEYDAVWKASITYEIRWQDHNQADRDFLALKISRYF